MRNSLRLKALFLALFMVVCFGFEGCSSKNQSKDSDEITIMAPLDGITEPQDNDSIKEKLEDATGEKIKFIWIPKDAYKNKSTMMMLSGDYPDILVVQDETEDIVKGVNQGGFYEITDYIKDYENLSKADKDILKNSSFNNKIYGIYRYCDSVDKVIVLNKNYLENSNLKNPETPEEFEEILESFILKNSNGDTYGLGIAGSEDNEFNNCLNEICAWFGAANSWKEEEDKLIPVFMTDEYKKGLKYAKDLYEKLLIDSKCYLKSSEDIISDFKSNKCLAVMTSKANAIKLKNEYGEENVSVISGVKENKNGKKICNKRYSGTLMFPKKGVKTEEKLKRVLSFLDKLNSKECYDIFTKSDIQDSDKLLSYSEINTNINNETNVDFDENNFMKELKKSLEVPKEEKACDITAPLKIQGNIKNSESFKANIQEISAKYVFGKIDDDGFEEEIQSWLENSGQDYIDDVNKLYSENND